MILDELIKNFDLVVKSNEDLEFLALNNNFLTTEKY